MTPPARFNLVEASFLVALLHPRRHNRLDGHLHAAALLALAGQLGTDTTTAARWAQRRWPDACAPRPQVRVSPLAELLTFQAELARRIERINRRGQA